MSLTDRVFSGASWLFFGQFLGYFAQLTSMTILVRLLLPADYGVFAIAIAFTTFGGLVINAGFGEALIQKQDVTKEDAQSVFWLTIMSAALVVIIVNVIARPAAVFYDAPILEWVLRSLSISFIVAPFSSVPNALMLKALRLNAVAIIQILSQLTSTLIMVILAFTGFGIWSLVIGSLLNTLIRTVLIVYVARWYPTFQFNLGSTKSLVRFTLNYFGFRFVSYWSRNIDSFVVGRVFNPVDLGLYNRAYGLMMFPTANLGNLLTQIMFPALATISDDKERVKSAYLQSVRLIMFLVFPMMFGLAVLAEPLVMTVYGENWRGMIIILQFLAPTGVLQSIVSTTYWIYLSQGRTDRMLRLELFNLGGTFGALLIGILLGSIEAIALGYLIVNLILFYPLVLIPGKLVNLHFSELIRSLWVILRNTLLMSIALIVVLHLFTSDWEQWQRSLAGIILAITTYFGLSIVTKDPSGKAFFVLARRRIIKPVATFLIHRKVDISQI